MFGYLRSGAALGVLFVTSSAPLRPRAPHAVELWIESNGGPPVRVTVSSVPAGAVHAESLYPVDSGAVTFHTPVGLRVDAEATHVYIIAPRDRSIRIVFGEGATPRERAQRLVGPRIALLRSTAGDLVVEAQVIPATD